MIMIFLAILSQLSQPTWSILGRWFPRMLKIFDHDLVDLVMLFRHADQESLIMEVMPVHLPTQNTV